ncbi:MAG: BrnT family toxin [Candidatus Margulisbacteria bacterium]|jgi:uncharacterized DUF497 family protein|nr:BrnT family toxin [Candidatus Margulisiibacteriota bacterium]
MLFEWDENKNRSNFQKHGINFDEAAKVFSDDQKITYEDARKNYGEKRQITIGDLNGIIISTVVHTDRSGKIRIISARPANRKERGLYYGNS